MVTEMFLFKREVTLTWPAPLCPHQSSQSGSPGDTTIWTSTGDLAKTMSLNIGFDFQIYSRRNSNSNRKKEKNLCSSDVQVHQGLKKVKIFKDLLYSEPCPLTLVTTHVSHPMQSQTLFRSMCWRAQVHIIWLEDID